jgi:bacteriocin biosynthesis cyclodehydratase domain-containing protein
MFHAHLMGAGSFFAELRRRLPTDSFVSSPDRSAVFDSTNWPAARARVLVTSVRDRAAERHLDTVARGTGKTWIPVQLEARSLRIGPVTGTPRAACLDCFDRRQEQHGRRSSTDVELERAHGPATSVEGFTPAHVDIAAAIISDITSSDERVAAATSSLWRFGHSDLSAKEAVVIPVSGCRRCDPGSGETTRSLQLSRYFPR